MPGAPELARKLLAAEYRIRTAYQQVQQGGLLRGDIQRLAVKLGAVLRNIHGKPSETHRRSVKSSDRHLRTRLRRSYSCDKLRNVQRAAHYVRRAQLQRGEPPGVVALRGQHYHGNSR